MPTFRITSPDGSIYNVTAPEGATQADVLARVQAQHTAPEKKADPGLMQRLSDAITAPIKRIPAQVGKEKDEAVAKYRTDIAKGGQAAAEGKPVGLAPVFDALDAAASPVTGTAHALLGQKVGDAALIFSPLGEEVAGERLLTAGAKEAGVGVNTLKKTLEASKAPAAGAEKANTAKAMTAKPVTDPEHAAAVAKLEARGVDMTDGQRKGGVDRRREEALKSNPLVGQAFRDQENKSIESFNRAAYNDVLSDIGQRYEGTKVGNEGFAQVEQKAGAAYDRLLPHILVKPDEKLVDDLHEVKVTASDLPPPQQQQFEAIVGNRVLKRLESGEMDGRTFKQVESELGHMAAGYKADRDFANRELGQRLEDTLGALRDNSERHSDPNSIPALKAANTTWAKLVRLRSAVTNRASSGGVFTPGDLMTAVKRNDRSAGKGAFARGDALLQDFASAANKVLPNRLPDSGTPERLAFNKQGLAEMAIAPLTNKTAELGLNMLKGQRGSPLTGRNYLSQITRQSSALAPPRPMLALPAAAIASQAGSQ